MSVNLKQVAERAGVSVRTVSNVVSGFALVAPDTRERVQRVLDELQYRPNAAARHLRGGRSGLIALVVPEIASPYFGELAGHLADGAEKHAWTLLVQQTAGDAQRERELLDGLRAQTVDGLIMSPWGLSPADLRRRPGSAPLVLLGEQDADGRLDHVAIDNVAAAGLPLDPALEIPVEFLHRADGAAAMRRLLDAGTPVDAVFCFSDQLALGALHTAHQHGLHVPRDLAVAGFDDIEDGRYAYPTLTTVAPDKHAIAEAALSCLAERLGRPGGRQDGRRVLVGHRVEVRGSTVQRF